METQYTLISRALSSTLWRKSCIVLSNLSKTASYLIYRMGRNIVLFRLESTGKS